MAKKSVPRRLPAPSRADVAGLKKALAACEGRIDKLERAMEINIKRMGAMQAEIDHLRARTLR